ncbi:MAG TPA: TolC family protein [Acidobacteriaceae bacterium]
MLVRAQRVERFRLTFAARNTRLFALALLVACGTVAARAQLSLSTVVDLALKNSPKVKLAQSDLERATATLRQAKDAYIPTLVEGNGVGYSWGFPLGQPTLFNFTSQSLLFDASQFSYMSATRAGIQASLFSLTDARQQVEVDAALTYIQLDNDTQQLAVMTGQSSAAQRLQGIVQQRLEAGVDSKMEFTRARLTGAQVHLKQLHLETEIATLRDHLSRLTGLPADSIVTDTASIPPVPTFSMFDTDAPPAAVQAAFANAKSKKLQARGDRRQVYLPQIAFVAQYARFATFNNYEKYYNGFQSNNEAIGVQITWPLFDRVRSTKADISAADAAHAQHEAEIARDTASEGNFKLRRNLAELAARQDVASLDRELAQQQLDIITVQLNEGSGNPNAPQITPRDEQNARIAAGQKSLEVLGADYQLHQAQLELLRATGGIEQWIRSAPASTPTSPKP